jgi:hypothetical protein
MLSRKNSPLGGENRPAEHVQGISNQRVFFAALSSKRYAATGLKWPQIRVFPHLSQSMVGI